MKRLVLIALLAIMAGNCFGDSLINTSALEIKKLKEYEKSYTIYSSEDPAAAQELEIANAYALNFNPEESAYTQALIQKYPDKIKTETGTITFVDYEVPYLSSEDPKLKDEIDTCNLWVTSYPEKPELHKSCSQGLIKKYGEAIKVERKQVTSVISTTE